MTDATHAHSHLKTYIAVYLALLALVLATVGAAMVKTGPLAFPIAMAIAGTKALLIVAIFMHARDESPLIRVFAAAGVFWLALMFAFLMSDYLTRHKMWAGIPSSDYPIHHPLQAVPGQHAPGEIGPATPELIHGGPPRAAH
jgi:cytochrome c oxidase subunit 4